MAQFSFSLSILKAKIINSSEFYSEAPLGNADYSAWQNSMHISHKLLQAYGELPKGNQDVIIPLFVQSLHKSRKTFISAVEAILSKSCSITARALSGANSINT